jgi:hypothetical protein
MNWPGDYQKRNIMMNHGESIKNGLFACVSGDAVRTFCLNCHANAHGKTFDFAATWELVQHPKPEK